MKVIVAKSKDWTENHLLEGIPAGSIIIHTGDCDIEIEAKRLGMETRIYPIDRTDKNAANIRNGAMLRQEIPIDLVRVFTHDLKRSRELNDLISRSRIKGIKTDIRS